jgi:small subunit ribosomal protein S7
MGKIKKRTINPDAKYNSALIAKLINYVLKKGKKTIATNIVYTAFDIIKTKTSRDPIDVFQDAIKNVRPLMEIKPKRIGGAVYQVPVEVNQERGATIAMRWIITNSKKKKGKAMQEKLANEIMASAAGDSESIRKKDSVHRMAEANKAFAHFGRSN